MRTEQIFTQEDRERIQEAVRMAETLTAGEIVPFVVGKSGQYPEAVWRAGALGAFVALFAVGIIDLGTDLWLPLRAAELSAIAIAAFGLGMCLPLIFPPMKLWFIPDGTIQQQVDERAGLAFLSEEVFDTRDRTGILILVSLFEHRVCVLGDGGINSAVQKEEWDSIVKMIVDGMKAGRPADGLISAIAAGGDLLARHRVERKEDDQNELSDSLRMSDQ